MITKLKEKYPGAAFKTEQQFYSKTMHPKLAAILDQVGHTQSVNGKFDLIVIDKDGFAHIYD
jgi:hypothetical protein